MEILQNTILKLIVRQGPDSDRQVIVLDSGELGYSTDLERLYIGNGFLSGGNVVGNIHVGAAPTITDATLYPSVIGDTAFATDSNKLYALKEGTGSLISDWREIGGVYSSSNLQITISGDNTISLNALSAGFIDNDALNQPLYINSGRVNLNPLSAGALSYDLLTDRFELSGGKLELSPISAGYVAMEALSSPLGLNAGKIALKPLSAGNVSSNAVQYPLTITNGKIALSASIPADAITSKTWQTGSGLTVTVGGYDYSLSAFNPLSANVVIESNQLYTKYIGASGIELASKGFAGVNSLSTGHYRLPFIKTLDPDGYVVMAQIYGTSNFGYEPRVVYTGANYCDILIMNSAGALTDADIMVKIDY